jgi:hypothetical protein
MKQSELIFISKLGYIIRDERGTFLATKARNKEEGFIYLPKALQHLGYKEKQSYRLAYIQRIYEEAGRALPLTYNYNPKSKLLCSSAYESLYNLRQQADNIFPILTNTAEFYIYKQPVKIFEEYKLGYEYNLARKQLYLYSVISLEFKDKFYQTILSKIYDTIWKPRTHLWDYNMDMRIHNLKELIGSDKFIRSKQ